MGLIVLIEMRIVLIVMPIDRRTDQSNIARKAPSGSASLREQNVSFEDRLSESLL
jgi:hypothetical protein